MKHAPFVRGSQASALFVVTLAIFTDMLVYGLAVPILPRHAVSLGVSQAAIGFLFGSYAFALLLATPLMGIISDRVGRRGPMLWGLLGLAAATFLFTFANSFPLLVLARALQGVAAAATWTAGLALLADLFPAEARGKAMGVAMSGMAMGTLIGPSFGGLLFTLGGYRLPFLIAAGLALVDGLARLLFLGNSPRQASRIQASGNLLRQRSILIMSVVVVMGAAIPGFLEPTLPLHLQERLGASPAVIGLLFGVPTLAYGISAPLSGALSDRFGRLPVILFGLLAAALALPLIGLPRSVIVEACVLLLLGVTLGLALTPTLPELSDIVDRFGGGTYGLVYAIYNVAYSLGLMCGPVAGGLLTGAFGLLTAVIVAGSVVLFSVPMLILVMRRGRKPDAPDTANNGTGEMVESL